MTPLPSPSAATLSDLLCEACYGCEHGTITSLLEQGANPNSPSSERHLPIERSAIMDDPIGVAMLIRAGADPNLCLAPELMPPLSLAAWFGCFDAAKALLDLGAHPLAKCSAGRSALHYACAEGLAAEGILLAERGGLCLDADCNGSTAVDLALLSGSASLCSCLGSLCPLPYLFEHIERWKPSLLCAPAPSTDALSTADSKLSPKIPAMIPAMNLALSAMLSAMAPNIMAEELRHELPDPGHARRAPL